MKFAFLAACCLLVPLFAQPQQLTTVEQPEHWVSLSDPASAKHWTGGIGVAVPDKAWKFENGVLHLASPKLGGSLFTEAQFDNFDLVFEWRIAPGGNTGVKYLSVPGRIHPDTMTGMQPWYQRLWIGGAIFAVFLVGLIWRPGMLKDAWPYRIALAIGVFMGLQVAALGWGLARGRSVAEKQPPGFEYQLIDDASSAVQHPEHNTGALYDLIGPSENKAQPVGEWNESRILVQGNHVEHWLNGSKIAEYELGSDALKQAVARSKFRIIEGFAEKKPGLIELQNHGTEAWFRNMRIRKL
ncbi:MAG TPA: DUF1080 domain-containing protein [Bryobacteraceae bacterium]|jgi:hypothetical protein|nr:DUF1080 domain-containing protein [Bryobacteraceae bacterium]